MRALLCLCLVLLTAGPLSAETYSWVDGEGVLNFSDDFNTVPKKYRKGVKRLGEENSPVQQKDPMLEKTEAPATKPVVAADGQLYAGKTQAAWRGEFDRQEAELKRLEIRLEQQRSVLKKAGQLSRARQTELFAEYETTRQEYNDKYKLYSDLLESARKAGLTVEIGK